MAKTVKEIQAEIGTIRYDLAKLEIEKKVKPAKDTNTRHKMRKQIAVMLTVIKQKELGIQK